MKTLGRGTSWILRWLPVGEASLANRSCLVNRTGERIRVGIGPGLTNGMFRKQLCPFQNVHMQEQAPKLGSLARLDPGPGPPCRKTNCPSQRWKRFAGSEQFLDFYLCGL